MFEYHLTQSLFYNKVLTIPCTLLNMVLKEKKGIIIWVQNGCKCSSCLPKGCVTDRELWFTDVASYHKRICISGERSKIKTAIQKSTSNKCWRGCGEKGTLLHCWWEYKLVQPLWRTVWRFLKKLEIELPFWSSNPHWGNQKGKRHVYPNVHHSTVYNSQDMEAT